MTVNQQYSVNTDILYWFIVMGFLLAWQINCESILRLQLSEKQCVKFIDTDKAISVAINKNYFIINLMLTVNVTKIYVVYWKCVYTHQVVESTNIG